jgi:hypothetical protein
MFDEEKSPPDEVSDTSHAKAMTILGLIVAAFFLLFWTTGCGTELNTYVSQTATTETVAVAPPPIPMFQIMEPAATETLMKAVRVDPPEPPPPPPLTAEEICNATIYRKLDPGPARICYNAVALELGWAPDVIAKWDAFLMTDVLKGESVHCPGVMGGADAARISYEDCSIPPGAQGRKSDAGFFQLHGDNYQPGDWLCVNFGYCSGWSIIQSPYHSMRAGLLFVMLDGKGPWCYNDFARRHHPQCTTVPRYWP